MIFLHQYNKYVIACRYQRKRKMSEASGLIISGNVSREVINPKLQTLLSVFRIFRNSAYKFVSNLASCIITSYE